MISKSELVELTQAETDNGLIEEPKLVRPRVGMVRRLRLLWNERRFMARCMLSGLVAATLVAFLIPKRYESTAQLMPPDSQSNSSLALLASLSGGSGGTSGKLLKGCECTIEMNAARWDR